MEILVLQCTVHTVPYGTGPRWSAVSKVLCHSVLLKQWLNCQPFCTLVHEITFSQWSQYVYKEKHLESQVLCDRRSKTVWWIKQVSIWNINFIVENVWKWSTSEITPLANSDGYFGGMKLWNSSVGNNFYPLPELHFAGLEYTDLFSWLFPENQLALDRILQNFEWQLILTYWEVRILSVFKMPMSIKNFLLTSLRFLYGDTSKKMQLCGEIRWIYSSQTVSE